MPKKQHTHHYIYKIVCKINEKYYIGMHSTSNLEDGYFGSGKVLKRSLNKYGKENHTFEILEYIKDRSSLKLREKELVNDSLLSDPMCMNLQIGGGGGFSGEEHKKKWILAGSVAGNAKQSELWKDPTYSMLRSSKNKKTMSDPEIKTRALVGFSKYRGTRHTEDTKKKIGSSNSVSQKGSSNSQYGTCWITNEKENKKIHRGDLIPDGWKLGRKIKN